MSGSEHSSRPLTLVCGWPAAGISPTRFELDSDATRAAASRIEPAFPD
ncbi:MAG: hypothetical protein ACTHO8_02360 [Solirubrobacterales bacterium]